MSNRDVWVNRCRGKISSRFTLAQAAVLRWEQLLRGARPRINTDNPRWMETPLREIATEAVAFDPEEFAVTLEGTPYDPPRPEPEDELDDLLDLDRAMDDDLDAEEASAEESAAAGSTEDAAAEAEGDGGDDDDDGGGDKPKAETQAGDAA